MPEGDRGDNAVGVASQSDLETDLEFMSKEAREDSTHASLRRLLELGLSKSGSAEPQTITRTVKFKIQTVTRPELIAPLNRHFNAFDEFRHKVLKDLKSWWDKDPDAFTQMVKCSKSKPFEKKPSCYGWLSTHFLTGKKLPPELMSKAAGALLDSLSGGLKSFLTRRATVSVEIKKRYDDNLLEWEKELATYAKDKNLKLPDAPPSVDFDKLTDKGIDRYNKWVGLVRMWCNLILIQREKLTRENACLPRYLKSYPGFPGSQRFREPVTIEETLGELEMAAREQAGKAPKRFADLNPEVWQAIQERFSPQEEEETETTHRPRTASQIVSRRFTALIEANPNWTPQQVAEEILAGIFRAADKLKKHLIATKYSDRRATIKFANLLNVAVVFAREPFRASGDYVASYEADIARQKAFGDLRGALHQPSDESSAIQITGFSVNDDGSPNYNGVLVCKSESDGKDSWAFLYSHQEGQTFQLASDQAKLRGKTLTEWTGFGSQGGSRKKAEASDKQLVKRRVWVSEKTPPTVLPLAFGARLGREYLWHFDRNLRTKTAWVLGNGRLLRIMPPGRSDLAEFYLTITMERQAPPVASVKAERLIGVDRGEAVPAAYAVIDSEGRLLENGRIAENYREQQRASNERKRKLQSERGGYTRDLRGKERNRAMALGGEVTRKLLSLAAAHRAPLVFESLNSNISTRGGKKTMMSQMQYTRVLTSLTQKFAETGLFDLKSKKWDNAFIKLVGPAYTSQTCSACGHVHSTEFYGALTDTLMPVGNGQWQATVAGSPRTLPESYTYWVRGKGEQTKNTNEWIRELLKERPIAKLSKTDRKSLVSHVRNRWLNFRPKQAEFQCLSCGHTMNADEQAALNIARKFLFAVGRGKKSGEMSEAERRKVRGEWETWYKEKLATVWKK
jgi:transposase